MALRAVGLAPGATRPRVNNNARRAAPARQRPVLVPPAWGGGRVVALEQPASAKEATEVRRSGGLRGEERVGLEVPAAAACAAALMLTAGPAAAAAAGGLADVASSAAPAALSLGASGPLQEGFVSAFLLIFFSEIGDKTFFIAVLLALQRGRGTVFAGTFGALALMTVISVALGRLFHVADEALPFQTDLPLDDILAVVLLVVFGVKTILDAGEGTMSEEEEDAKEAVAGLTPSGALVLSTFTLVFAAEWGDKSFLATIALAAAQDPVGVTLGAVSGHGVATAIAVLTGDILGDVVDEKVVAYAGGSLFLLFAAATAADVVSSMS